MKIYCIHNARIPTEKAHGWQICKMCESLSSPGREVELIVPGRRNFIKQDAFSYYGLKRNFKIRYVACFDFLIFARVLGKFSFWIQSLLFLRKLKKMDLVKQGVVITRNPEIAGYYSHLEKKVFYDAHNWPNTKIKLFKKMLSKTKGIICNSAGTAGAYGKNGFKNILIAPNGVDLKLFDIQDDKKYWRSKYKINLNQKIIMYVGHLYEWKGIDVVIKAAEILKDKENIKFVLVGGTSKDVAKYSAVIIDKGFDNVLLIGHRQASRIPGYIKSADILLLPNMPSTKESKYYTSPIKMFEYMASGRPIIASDLPSIRQVLNEKNSLLIPAGDPQVLAGAIEALLSDSAKAGLLASRAIEDVKEYTWEKRAQKIIEFINRS